MHQIKRWFCWMLVLSVALPLSALPTDTSKPTPEYITVRDGLPQGFIKSLVQDRRGFIWLATRDGLCRYDGVRFRIYNHDAQQPKSLSFSSILEIREDNRGRLWIRTENNDVDCFDPVTEQSARVSNSAQFRQALGRDQLVSIQPDRLGNVWVATQSNGFFLLHANGTVSHRQWAIQNNTVQQVTHALLLDKGGQLWLATRNGLFRYTPTTSQYTNYQAAQGLPQPDVYNLHERTNGELMLGFPGQVALFNPKTGLVRLIIPVPGSPTAGRIPLFTKDERGVDYVNQHYYTDRTGLVPSPADPKLSQYPALSILVDRSNVLWMGLNGDGVIKCDLNKKAFRAWPYTHGFHIDWLTQQFQVPLPAIPPAIQQQTAFNMRYLVDRRKTLWLSSSGTTPYRYDAVRQTFDAVKPTGINPNWLPGGLFRLTALSTGPQGELWGLLGPNSQAVIRHNPDLQTFTAFPLPLPANHPYQIQAMVVDGGRIYLATKNHGLLRADLSTRRLVRWHAGGDGALPNNTLLCLAQDPAQYNHLWIGTFGSGLCQLDKLTGRIRRFSVAQGLPNNVIYAIRPDADGHLWLSTNRGLCRFDSRTYEVRSYTADDGLPNEEFNRFHDVTLPDGRLIFGGIGGYTIFDPRRVNEDAFKPLVALTSLRINNQPIRANTPNSPIQQDINETPEIVLDHQQNFISVDFAALQFNNTQKNQYRYKLVGLDKDWVYSGNVATATYTNLSPGTYTFMVNASNTSGVWSPHTRQIRLVIEPPVWASWWAYVLYLLLLLGAIGLFLRIRLNRIRLKTRMELREQESAQLKHLDELKTRFFANITHEFRTPLTLILTPLEQLLTDKTIADDQRQSRLSLIYRNANRLLRLINELLDLAKLDAGKLSVTPAPGDLPEFVERITTVFNEEALRKHIRLQINTQLTQPYYWFDSDKVEKILNNLLSNALKFTPENGLVSVTISAPGQVGNANPQTLTQTERIRLVVRDTGIGIDPKKLPLIFNRFYQTNPSVDGSVGGSGIGLALVKELVEVMHGSVSVESERNTGTTFTIELPCRPALAQSVPLQADGQSRNTKAAGVSLDANAAHILLVEDNDDIADYVVSVLSAEWHVHRVSNGQQGIDTAIAEGPDLIISDVIMPELNGYELCRQLKDNPATSHIPIILLTAKAALESRVEGLAAGADDYVAKPFQVDELLGRVRNRLEQQQRMRLHYRAQLLREGHLPIASQAPQDEFMNRVYEVLETRLDDSTFGVEPLAASVGMSRMHLNRKIKAMTGMTPNELIRVVRLRRAAELLLTGASISAVADLVGFDTPAYFSKVFKEQYHLTPSEYVDQNRQEVI
ncbi:hybrid sensor histidine kinase/response regulator transcription factor [Spirosoma fluminis]